MRVVLAVLFAALVAGGCVGESPSEGGPSVFLAVSKAQRPMPGAIEISAAELSTPALMKLGEALEQAERSEKSSASVPVTPGERDEVFRFLHEKWTSLRSGAPPNPLLVRYGGSDFGVSSQAY